MSRQDVRVVNRGLIEVDMATAAIYQAEIHASINDLRILLPDLELLVDTRQLGDGFSTPEGRDATDRMIRTERAERRAQPTRRDDHGRPIIGLRWLNRPPITSGTGEVTPGNFRGIATTADLAFTLVGHVHRIRRTLLASGYPDPEPDLLVPAGAESLERHQDVDRMLSRLDRLVDAAPSVQLLGPIDRDLERLVEDVSRVVDGPDRTHRPDPCPHCGHHTLIRYEATRRRPQPFTRCERDPRWKSKHFRPCVCTAAICQCKADPVTYRHEWFDNPRDKTQRPVWDLIDRIKLIKENTVLETQAQDAVQRVRDLHQALTIHVFAEDCPGEHWEPDEDEAAERGVEPQLVTHQHIEDPAGSGGDVCVTCDPAVIACSHCTHDTDARYTPHPCPTIAALDAATN